MDVDTNGIIVSSCKLKAIHACFVIQKCESEITPAE